MKQKTPICKILLDIEPDTEWHLPAEFSNEFSQILLFLASHFHWGPGHVKLVKEFLKNFKDKVLDFLYEDWDPDTKCGL